jgi:hypothetical protein
LPRGSNLSVARNAAGFMLYLAPELGVMLVRILGR